MGLKLNLAAAGLKILSLGAEHAPIYLNPADLYGNPIVLQIEDETPEAEELIYCADENGQLIPEVADRYFSSLIQSNDLTPTVWNGVSDRESFVRNNISGFTRRFFDTLHEHPEHDYPLSWVGPGYYDMFPVAISDRENANLSLVLYAMQYDLAVGKLDIQYDPGTQSRAGHMLTDIIVNNNGQLVRKSLINFGASFFDMNSTFRTDEYLCPTVTSLEGMIILLHEYFHALQAELIVQTMESSNNSFQLYPAMESIGTEELMERIDRYSIEHNVDGEAQYKLDFQMIYNEDPSLLTDIHYLLYHNELNKRGYRGDEGQANTFAYLAFGAYQGMNNQNIADPLLGSYVTSPTQEMVMNMRQDHPDYINLYHQFWWEVIGEGQTLDSFWRTHAPMSDN